MEIINKLGGFSRCYTILKNNGWNKDRQVLLMQTRRKSLSKEVCLILNNYCQRHNIPITLSDFWGKVGNQ